MSAFRDELAGCPRCKAPLDPPSDPIRLGCASCEGILIDEAAVAEQITPEGLKLEDREPNEPALICPRCTTPMAPKHLYGIEIDRCATHGLWFDGEELRRVLETAEKEHSSARATTAQKVVGGLGFAALIALQIVRFVYFWPH